MDKELPFTGLLGKLDREELSLTDLVVYPDEFLRLDESGQALRIKPGVFAVSYATAYIKSLLQLTQWDNDLSDGDKVRLISDMLCRKACRNIAKAADNLTT